VTPKFYFDKLQNIRNTGGMSRKVLLKFILMTAVGTKQFYLPVDAKDRTTSVLIYMK